VINTGSTAVSSVSLRSKECSSLTSILPAGYSMAFGENCVCLIFGTGKREDCFHMVGNGRRNMQRKVIYPVSLFHHIVVYMVSSPISLANLCFFPAQVSLFPPQPVPLTLLAWLCPSLTTLLCVITPSVPCSMSIL